MTKLILLGGPTGVGKTTTLKLLQNRLAKSAILDADDVWRISEDLAVAGTRRIAVANIVSVLRGYIEARCETAILSWVFARPELFEPIILQMRDHVASDHQFYLVASEDVLRQRLQARNDLGRLQYAIGRLRMIENLAFPKIDTTELDPSQVADRLVEAIQSL